MKTPETLFFELHAPLAAILRAELAAGNEISEIQEHRWTKVDLVVSLKFPFQRTYARAEDVVLHRNRDAHYSLTDSYASARHRQAVEAPY